MDVLIISDGWTVGRGSLFLSLLLLLIIPQRGGGLRTPDSAQYYPILVDHNFPPRSVKNSNANSNNSSSGNGAFVQIPHSNPPTVRPPPYAISDKKCPPVNIRENWVDTLCGDLNTGYVPRNPFGHKFPDSYPFEIMKNKTLEFFRRALPILKKDKSLPKVARYSANDFKPPTLSPSSSNYQEKNRYRIKRGVATREAAVPPTPLLDAYYPDVFYPDGPTQRRRRQQGNNNSHNRFCDNTMNYYNRLCKIYNAMWGKAPHNLQRDTASLENRYYQPNFSKPKKPGHRSPSHYSGHPHRNPNHQALLPSIDVAVMEPTKSVKAYIAPPNPHGMPNELEMPPTPCPSSAEYLTPVFARNHEGAWRYVVQIPKEGYFTQTVEVTKCLKSNCFYMDGSCKTSPRWQSLLVAELYYPDASFPTTTAKPKIFRNSNEDEYADSGGSGSTESYKDNQVFNKERIGKTDRSQCDGFDELGCYQVRLFYDWFLIPGSCKCWKRQFDFTSGRAST